MTPLDFRQERGFTLAEMAELVGVKSRGYISMIERGAPCSVAVALEYERLSNGRVPAATLSRDVALVDAARDRCHNGTDARYAGATSSGKVGDISGGAAA
ncbi:helix-turn-helix transcriptional regulator [uncultured Sphingomonas sp.]|uniref:helix-turn-helix transcriptional regulator n=1 Tax=uncultured Sphingomonas sp. TaxID=158754 RepID=UPI0030D9A120